jgi:hypothetical protein
MEASAADPDLEAKAHDRVAVDAGQPFDGANRAAFGEGCDDHNLLFEGKNVHGGQSQV